MINTAVIGYGYSAKTFHIPFIQALGEFNLAALVTSQPDAAKQALPDTQCYKNVDELLKDSKVELVIITAPNALHFQLASQCIAAGKHVVVEKPFVTQIAQGQDLINQAKQTGKLLSVFHNRRWDGDFLSLQGLIDSEQLGEIKVFESRFDRFRPQVRQRWREQPGEGAGILYDLGPHLIDQALYLFGFPLAVTARCLASRQNSQACDYFHLNLHYQDKEIILGSSPFCASPPVRFHLQGTKGNYRKSGLDYQEDCLKRGIKPATPEWFEAIQEPPGKLFDEEGSHSITTQKGNYLGYFKSLADSINNGSKPPVHAQDTLDGLKVIEAAIKSSEQQKTILLEK